jgi:hypothetical protein
MTETIVKPPFSLADLTELENHQIPVYPVNQHWLAAMRDRVSAHPEDTTPAGKLMNSLVELSPGNWGFSLPKKCCLFVAERQAIKSQTAARDKAVASYFRLIQKIAKALKKPQQEVAQLVARSFEHLDVLDPWLEEITAATSQLQATDTDVATVTVMVQQRLNKHWTEFDTLSLPEALFNTFLDYVQGEETAWKQPEVEEDLMEADVVEVSKEKLAEGKSTLVLEAGVEAT